MSILHIKFTVALLGEEWNTNDKNISVLCCSQVWIMPLLFFHFLNKWKRIIFVLLLYVSYLLFGLNPLTSVFDAGAQIRMQLLSCILLQGFLLPEALFRMRINVLEVQG